MEQDSNNDLFAQFLDPEVTRTRLIALSVYLAAYESLERSIVDHLRSFYSSKYIDGEWEVTNAYREKVLSRNRSVKHASLDWLHGNEALSEADLATFKQIKACRNDIAHKMWEMISKGTYPDRFLECFEQLVALVRKIEVWWIVNVELEINPDFEGQDIDEDLIVPGPCMMLDMLRQVALGSTEESEDFLNEYLKQTSASSANSAVNP